MESILIIHWDGIYEFSYPLGFVIQKLSTCYIWANVFAGQLKAAEIGRPPKGWNQISVLWVVCSLYNVLCIVAFWVIIVLFQVTPTQSVEVLYRVLKFKTTVMCFKQKIKHRISFVQEWIMVLLSVNIWC